jgi:hypothetical protein
MLLGLISYIIRRDAKNYRKYFVEKSKNADFEENPLLKRIYSICTFGAKDIVKGDEGVIKTLNSINNLFPNNNFTLNQAVNSDEYMRKLNDVVHAITQDEKLFSKLSKIKISDGGISLLDHLYVKFRDVLEYIQDNSEIIYVNDFEDLDPSRFSSSKSLYGDLFIEFEKKYGNLPNRDIFLIGSHVYYSRNK